MKKLGLLITLLGNLLLFSQSATADLNQFKELVTLATNSLDNNSRLDSISGQLDIISKNSTDPLIRTSAIKFISTLSDLKNTNYTAKPIIHSFESMEKDYQKKYTFDYDKFKNAGFIQPKKNYADRIKLYVTIKDNTARLRLVTKYNGNGWLFFKKAIFIIDDKNYEYNAGDTRTDVVSGSNVKEVSDLAVDENLFKIINSIVQSNSAVEYRLTGDKYQDFKLTEKEKDNIMLGLEIYRKLTE